MHISEDGAAMGNASLITIDLPNYRVGQSGEPGVLPVGHAGAIVNNGDGTGTYYEWGLYQPSQLGTITANPNDAGNIRALNLTGLQYNSAGNITQSSLNAALNTIFGSSGMYTTDTGAALVQSFTVSQSQLSNINKYLLNKIDLIGGGLDNYSIRQDNDCASFVYQLAAAAGVTISATSQAGYFSQGCSVLNTVQACRV